MGQVRPPVELGDPSGGIPTTVPWSTSYDANLDELLAQVPVTSVEPDNKAAVSVQVVAATVIATLWVSPNQPVRRANREFYLGDGRGAIKVFFPADQLANHAPFDVRVGQRVSVRVTEVTNYFGLAEVSAVEEGSWQLVSEDNPVPIDDRTGEAITLADVNHLVRLTGTISGAGSVCGTSAMCWPLSHGGQTVMLRTDSAFVAVGSCATFVGPVAVYDAAPQLNGLNFDWLWVAP